MMSLKQVFVAVTVWWTAKIVTNFVSMSVMNLDEISPGSFGAATLTSAFLDMRWIELTFIQYLLGITVLMVSMSVMKKSFWPTEAHKATIFIATLANVVGNLAANAAYAFVSSSATQMFKSFGPIITFVLSLLLYRSQCTVDFNFSTILSIVTMVVGSCAFAVLDSTANIWSLIAVIISNVSFTTHNIYFKKIVFPKENAVQKYAMIYMCSVVLLFPILIVKVVSTRTLLVGTQGSATITFSIFHFLYNVASVSVLQEMSPTSHAVLNLARRVTAVLLKILYFNKPPFSVTLSVAIGLLVFLLGLGLYCFRKSAKRGLQYSVLVMLISTFTCFQSHKMGLLGTQFAPSKYSHITSPVSHLLHCPSTQYVASSSITIFTAWSFTRPVSSNVISNVKRLKDSYPDEHVHVYCGSSECVCSMSKVKNITTEFIVVSELVKNTPLEKWLARHPLNKVFAASEFEHHLQVVTQLAILWKHGGMFMDPMVRMGNRVKRPISCETGWIGKNIGNSSFDVSCFPKHHVFIKTLVEHFVHNYTNLFNHRTRLRVDFQHIVENTTSKCRSISETCPETLPLQYEKKQHLNLNQNGRTQSNPHFNILSFDQQLPEPSLAGDFQGLSMLQFLPFVDRNLMEGDSIIPTLSQWHSNMTIFLNGKWTRDNSQYWPLSETSNPIMVSFCIDNSSWIETEFNVQIQLINYLKKHEPIGCYDSSTLEILRDNDVQSYFSGGLSLMVKKPTAFGESTVESDKIYLVDVEHGIKEMLPRVVQEGSIEIHLVRNSQDRLTVAYEIMETYASAKLVVTQRIHYALPCVAMGIPVVFINSPGMPGGGGSKSHSSACTVGLTPLFHTVDMYKMSHEEAKKWLHNFDWKNPPPNPNVNIMMRMRATFWDVIRQNQVLYDAAYKFGTIPLKPPVPNHANNNNQLLFHLIFTTSNSSIIKLSKSSIFEQLFNWHRETVNGGFNWQHWRTVESIFYHHPFAKVIIHSNTLQQSVFDVLTEVGYNIEVRSYKLEELLENSPAAGMIEKLPEARNGSNSYWYSHETDLLRFLILYKWGGVYLDMDVIVERPFDSLHNVLGWEENELSLNGAVLKFDAGNLFLKAALEEFSDRYKGNCWACNGPLLLTRVYNKREESWSVTALKNTAFYMFHWSVVKSQCFSTTSKETYDANMKILIEEAYAVHLNSKITAKQGAKSLTVGTICKHLLNSYCILCNYQY